jgi:hypothetical protein
MQGQKGAQAHVFRRGRWTLHDLLRGLDILSGGGACDGGKGVAQRKRLIAISLSRRSSAEVVAGVHAWASRALPGTCRFQARVSNTCAKSTEQSQRAV